MDVPLNLGRKRGGVSSTWMLLFCNEYRLPSFHTEIEERQKQILQRQILGISEKIT